MSDLDITTLMDRERKRLTAEAVAIRASGAKCLYDPHGDRWIVEKFVGPLVLMSEGTTVQEALEGLEAMA